MPENATSSAIDFDLECVGCGYNLRTLNRASVCPECARRIVESESAHRLRSAKRQPLHSKGLAWLRSVRHGVVLAALAWLMATVCGLLLDLQAAPFPREALITVAPLASVHVISAWAAWYICTPLPASRFRLTLPRAFILIALLSPMLCFINARWANYYFSGKMSRASVHRIVDIAEVLSKFGDLFMLWGIAASILVFVRLASIARDARKPLIAGTALLFAILAPFCELFLHAAIGTWSSWDALWVQLRPTLASAIPSYLLQPLMTFNPLNDDGYIAIMLSIGIAHCMVLVIFSTLYIVLTRAIRLSESPEASSQT